MSDPTLCGDSKRPIRKRDFAFLQREMEHWRGKNLISDQQERAIGALYSPSRGHFSQVLVALGAMLVGLGLLSYIAANWMDLSRTVRVVLILAGYVLAMLGAWRLEDEFPKTSSALRLLGGFIYGGGIFLIAQIFNEGGHYTTALFWWMAGVVPAALLFKDRLQLVLLQVVALVYINGFYNPWHSVFYYGYGNFEGLGLLGLLRGVVWPPEPVLTVLALWGIWRFIDNDWSFGFRMNTFISLNLLAIHAQRFSNDFAVLMLVGVVVGALLCICAFGRWKWELGGWGVLLSGLSGLVLTVPDVWRWSRVFRNAYPGEFAGFEPWVALSVCTAILVCVAMLWFMHRGFTAAIPVFCLLVLRYYFDRFYDFMPKALFFTVGGLLLIGMGFWLERTRKKVKRQRSTQDEEQSGEVRS